VASAGFVDGDGVVGGLKLRVIEGKDDAGRCLGCERLGAKYEKGDEKRGESSQGFHG
jgi:hypothetical protein